MKKIISPKLRTRRKARGEKTCTSADLAAVLVKCQLSETEAVSWNRDLLIARKQLKPIANKWKSKYKD